MTDPVPDMTAAVDQLNATLSTATRVVAAHYDDLKAHALPEALCIALVADLYHTAFVVGVTPPQEGAES